MSSSKPHMARLALPITLAASLGLASPASAQSSAQTSTPVAAPSSAASSPELAVWAGATLFSLTYIASALGATTAYTDDGGTYSSRTVLWVPVAGPFVQMASIDGAGWSTLLALDGLAQIGGLTLFVYGLLSPSAPPAQTARPASSRPTIALAPFALHGASGAALVGTF